MRNTKLISRSKGKIDVLLKSWFTSNVTYSDRLYIKKFGDENCEVTIYIAEVYYYRINSTLTVTVIVEETADKTTVEIISSGGKAGYLGISWGSENSAVTRIADLLKKNGFTEMQ